MGSKSLFNEWCWENWISHMQKNPTAPLTHTIHKYQLKIDTDLKTWNLKLLEENIGG